MIILPTIKNHNNNMSTISKPFPPDAGTFISEHEALKLRDEFFKREKEKHHHEDFTRAYFFGREKIQSLLDYDNGKDEIVGVRIYYGIDIDGDGKDDQKMVLYPVNNHGKDVIMHHKQHASTRSAALDSDAESNSLTGGGTALDGGLPCPSNCP
jgi:hypothetical protein